VIKPKAAITVMLALFVLASLAFLIAKELSAPGQRPERQARVEEPIPVAAEPGPDTQPASAPAEPAAARPAPKASRKIIAYYFHGDARCPSCLRIEAWTRSAIDLAFAGELREGRLEWRVVNVDEPRYAHFVRDYQLYTKSVVLVELRDGKQTRWKNLNRVWELLQDNQAYWTYVTDEVAAYLKGG